MASQTAKPQRNPELIFDTLNAYQQTAALKAAIQLDIFTAIGEGADTVPVLAKRCQATERGVRILCDYLVVYKFLTKQGQKYGLTEDSAIFLDRRSPAYIGSMAGFLTLPQTINAYHELANTIRTGRPAMAEGEGSISAENPIWVEFAHSISPRDTASSASRLPNRIRMPKSSRRTGRRFSKSPRRTRARLASSSAFIVCRAAPSTSTSVPVTTSF
jgi:hypothetical protein